MSNFLSTTDLNAEALKESFITFLRTQDRFKDYNFSGSNMSVLLDILVQNTVYNNHYQNMIGAESFLDSAELRESIVSRAKELNYVPKSRTSSRAVIDLEIFPSNSPNSILLPKGYEFKSAVNGSNYYYQTRQNYTITKNNSRYLLEGIEIYEGEMITEYFNLHSTITDGVTIYSNNITLQSENIDLNSIEVWVTIDGVKTKFTKTNSLLNLKSNSRVFFVQGYRANHYEIVFGDGVLGEAVSSGSIVEVSYVDTIGSLANGVNVFDRTDAIDGYSDISITTSLASYGGSDRESNENIKFHAPRHFATQERGVTTTDFKNLILTNFPEIEAVSAYGGEEELNFGKVIICLKPYNGTRISTNLSNRIINFLKTKSMRIPVVKTLEYFYVNLYGNIRYNSQLTTDSAGEIKSSAITALVALNETKFNDFNQNIYLSSITDTIIDSHTSIVSAAPEIKMIKRITPVVNVSTSYEIDFTNQLKSYNQTYATGSTIDNVIISDSFTYDYNDTDYECWIQDDGTGSIGLYTLNTLGAKTKLKDIGTVNYTTGLLLFNVKIKGYTNYISIYAKLAQDEIIVSKNKFILLDSADFNLTMVQNA